MTEFETLLNDCRNAVERFVRFKISSKPDADDILQETYLAALRGFGTLTDKAHFRAWMISIARNKCNDHFRGRMRSTDISINELPELPLTASRFGYIEQYSISEAMDALSARDRQMIELFYIQGYRHSEIAQLLGVPVGTVKSRLYTARNNFKQSYLNDDINRKVDVNMKKLPEIMPEYTITRVNKEPFPVKWEELMGWFIIPRLGERLSWAMYEQPSRARTERVELRVTGKAEIHGIKGVEIAAKEYQPMECNRTDNAKTAERTFIAQLTDTHCRFLAESHQAGGVRKLYTFLDGDVFLENWGFGENNCGNEVDICAKGDIIRDGDNITAADKPFLLDVVGRYEVRLGGIAYDTVCVMDIEAYNGGVVSEQYLDKDGRTVLWRRFNRNDWAKERYKKSWTEQLPDNQRITVNGEVYVHWYDCITEHIL